MRGALAHMWEMGGFMLLALPLWILGRTLWLLHLKEAPRPWREFLLTGFVLFVLGLLSQTLTFIGWTEPEMSWLEFARWRWEQGYGINLTPGYTIRTMWERGSQTLKILNMAGNVLIFAPMLVSAIFVGLMAAIASHELLWGTGLVKHVRLNVYSAVMAFGVAIWSYFGCPYAVGLVGVLLYSVVLFAEMMAAK